MPYLGELAAEYDAEEFKIIGVVSDVPEGRDQTLAENMVRQTGANYPHLLLNESIYNTLLTDVTIVPTTFFLDQDGIILDTILGAKKKLAWKRLFESKCQAELVRLAFFVPENIFIDRGDAAWKAHSEN